MGPLLEMMRSAGLPLLTVAVETGVLVDVEIVTCAKAGPETAMRGPIEAAAARNLRFISETLDSRASKTLDRARLIRLQLGAFQGKARDGSDCHAQVTSRDLEWAAAHGKFRA